MPCVRALFFQEFVTHDGKEGPEGQAKAQMSMAGFLVWGLDCRLPIGAFRIRA